MLSIHKKTLLLAAIIFCSQVACNTYQDNRADLDKLAGLEVKELRLAHAINHASTPEERARKTAEMAELCTQKAILLMRTGDTQRARKYCQLSATHFEDVDFYNNPMK